MFVIVGQKDADCYVIQDVREGMGGKCCCSKYTIAQLLQAGHQIVGARLTNGKVGSKDVIVCNLDGTPAKTNNTWPNVDDTKRSAVTIEKGIKLSRAETKARNDAAKKRVATLKANKKEAKVQALAAEKLAKEKAKQAAKEKAILDKMKKHALKTKPIFILDRMEDVCGEYQEHSMWYYTVELRSPSALSTFKKGLMKGEWKLYNMNDVDSITDGSASKAISRYGKIKYRVESTHPVGHFHEDEVQVVANPNQVVWDFRQDYEDYSFTCAYMGIKKEPRLSCVRHCSEEDLLRRGHGATANGGGSITGVRQTLLKLGYLID